MARNMVRLRSSIESDAEDLPEEQIEMSMFSMKHIET